MKKIVLSIFLALVFVSGSVLAQDVDIEQLVIVTNGVYSYTNNVADSRLDDDSGTRTTGISSESEALHCISFKLPTSVTNTFTINIVKQWPVEATDITWVVTNDITDSGELSVATVTTNSFPGRRTSTQVTNTYYSITTTNDTALQIYDWDDLPKGVTVEPEDIVEYKWTGYTNSSEVIYVRIAKELYKR